MVEKEMFGMTVWDREMASSRMGKSLSTIDKIVARSRRKGKHKKLRFLQEGKGCAIWFPVPWLIEFFTNT